MGGRRIGGVPFLLFFLIFLLPDDAFSGSHFIEYTSSGKKVLREWDPPVIKWRYQAAGAPEGARDIIANAFAVWKSSTQADVEFEYAGTSPADGPTVDGFCDIFFNVDLTSLGLGSNIIAFTFRNGSVSDTPRTTSDRILEDADIVLNPAFKDLWISTVPTDPSQLDLQEIITHEIGHLLGLAHSFLIDAVMYPAKPTSGSNPQLKSLFRVPKRSLAQDDIAWLGSLYPTDAFEDSTAVAEGYVAYGKSDYAGAHVIALKKNEDDLDFQFYPNESSGDLIVKGMKNVSAFTDEDGDFEIPGLLPGDYVFAIQDANAFLDYSLANVNSYLRINASSLTIPTAFNSNPDCGNREILTPTNIEAAFAAISPLSISAGRALCGLDFIAHTGEQKCLSSAEDSSSCGGSGGCAVAETQSVSWQGIGLSLLGIIIILFSLKMNLRKPPRPKVKKHPLDKNPT